MGRNPEYEFDEELDEALNYLPESEQINNKLFMQFKRRKDLINDWRFVSLPYLKNIDGSNISCFSYGHQKIDLKRFLAWYGHEKFNWENMPEEMAEMAEQLSQGITTSEAPKEAQKPLKNNEKEHPSTKRANENELAIIGALLDLLEYGSRQYYNQTAVKAEIAQTYKILSVSTLDKYFAEANKAFEQVKNSKK